MAGTARRLQMAIYILFEQRDRVIGGNPLRTDIPLGYCEMSKEEGSKLPDVEYPKVAFVNRPPNPGHAALLGKSYYFCELQKLSKERLAEYLHEGGK